MRRKLSSTFEHSIPVLAVLAFASLVAASGGIWALDARVGPNSPGTQDPQNNQSPKASDSETPFDPQVKAVLDKIAVAGVAHPTTVADVRRAYLFYPKLSGSTEHVFRVENRQIPGSAGNIPVLCTKRFCRCPRCRVRQAEESADRFAVRTERPPRSGCRHC